MPCGTCGGYCGGNTRTCPFRGAAEYGSGLAGEAAGRTVGHSADAYAAAHGVNTYGAVGYAAAEAGKHVAQSGAHRAMMTPSQERYKREHGHYAN